VSAVPEAIQYQNNKTPTEAGETPETKALLKKKEPMNE